MPRVQEHPERPEGGRKYGAFQTEIYANGILNNKLPIVTTDPNKLEEQAKRYLGERSFNYVAGGAGEKATMDANRLAFRQWKLLRRAKSNGYKVLVVTLDTWALAWRPADLDNAYVPFVLGTGNQIGFSDPVFRAKFAKKHSNKTPEDNVFLAAREWEADVYSGAAHTWKDLELLKAEWDGPIVLKGIQHVRDARMAVEAGVQGIIVSNHGGRQLDGAIGSLEVLPEIAEAVGGQVTVLFDSGIRTGVDVVKALCLGAKGVLIGRPWVYGFGINGKSGARDVLRGILADLDQSMGLAGIKTISGCNRGMVRRVQYGGDVIASH
ncbi:MAG: hypothetical protein Q9222_004292 [Ikaeria aurantiellina]